jgi:hypothetical protein
MAKITVKEVLSRLQANTDNFSSDESDTSNNSSILSEEESFFCETDSKFDEDEEEVIVSKKRGRPSKQKPQIESDTSKYKTKWTKMNPNSFKSIRNNSDFKEQIGPTQFAKKHIDSTALSAFHFIFDDSMVKMISSFTN